MFKYQRHSEDLQERVNLLIRKYRPGLIHIIDGGGGDLIAVKYYPPDNMVDYDEEARPCSSQAVEQLFEELQIEKIIDALVLGKQFKEQESVGILRRISS